jgi:CoA:oxalate CoA-transferase
MTDGKAAGALQGIRVLDFSAMIAGPYCARLMADSGADVIKIEPPEGDYMRSRAPMRAGRSVYFGVLNAGKRSIALDLKRPEGRARPGARRGERRRRGKFQTRRDAAPGF